MNITRKSFLKRVGAFVSSLFFWRTPSKASPPIPKPTVPAIDFQGDGLKHIMWAIDKYLGEPVGADPWEVDQEGIIHHWPPKPEPARKVSRFVNLYQRHEDRDGSMIYQMKWGADDFSPVFESRNHMDCYQQAIGWAKSIPNSKVWDEGLTIYERA